MDKKKEESYCSSFPIGSILEVVKWLMRCFSLFEIICEKGRILLYSHFAAYKELIYLNSDHQLLLTSEKETRCNDSPDGGTTFHLEVTLPTSVHSVWISSCLSIRKELWPPSTPGSVWRHFWWSWLVCVRTCTYYWNLVQRDQGHHQTPYKAEDSPHSTELPGPNHQVLKLKNPAII